MYHWMFRKTLLIAMWFAVRANKTELKQGRLLQVKFGRKVDKNQYDGLLVVVDGSVVRLHDAKAVEVTPEGEPVEGNNGPTVH